jgi:regulator of sirC expression with transglutaminase-like and TPR domain
VAFCIIHDFEDLLACPFEGFFFAREYVVVHSDCDHAMEASVKKQLLRDAIGRSQCDCLVMTQAEARARFLETIDSPDEEIDLAEACLWISAEANEGLTPEPYCEKLDGLAESVRAEIEPTTSVADRTALLNEHLFLEHGYRGNENEYYDPQNSYLDCVIDRKTGIPISLAILWMSVAQRVGIPAYGVGFPGHFLVGVETDPAIFVDAFSAVVLTAQDCEERLRAIAGDEVKFSPAMLAPSTRRQTLARVLRNLKQIHIRSSNFADAVACIDRILALDPDNPNELRDRGVLHRSLECWSFAREDLERFVEIAPTSPDVKNIELILDELRVRTAHIH